MAKGIKRKIRVVLKQIDAEISAFAKRGFFAAGLASEGYNGGYRDALLDILLELGGVSACNQRYWWEGEGERG